MNRVFLASVFVAVSLSAGVIQVSAQNPNAAVTPDRTAPSYDLKGQSLLDLEAVQKKFVDLANVVPANKFTWRPSADSRSFAEVFLHVAGERYGILGLMGAPPPEGYDLFFIETSTTEKAQIVAELNKSWEFTQKTINEM